MRSSCGPRTSEAAITPTASAACANRPRSESKGTICCRLSSTSRAETASVTTSTLAVRLSESASPAAMPMRPACATVSP